MPAKDLRLIPGSAGVYLIGQLMFRLPLRIAHREEQYLTSFAAAASLFRHVFTGLQPREVLRTQNNTSHHQHPRFLPGQAPTSGAQPSVMDTR
jgi:hypothetical protein